MEQEITSTALSDEDKTKQASQPQQAAVLDVQIVEEKIGGGGKLSRRAQRAVDNVYSPYAASVEQVQGFIPKKGKLRNEMRDLLKENAVDRGGVPVTEVAAQIGYIHALAGSTEDVEQRKALESQAKKLTEKLVDDTAHLGKMGRANNAMNTGMKMGGVGWILNKALGGAVGGGFAGALLGNMGKGGAVLGFLSPVDRGKEKAINTLIAANTASAKEWIAGQANDPDRAIQAPQITINGITEISGETSQKIIQEARDRKSLGNTAKDAADAVPDPTKALGANDRNPLETVGGKETPELTAKLDEVAKGLQDIAGQFKDLKGDDQQKLVAAAKAITDAAAVEVAAGASTQVQGPAARRATASVGTP